MKRIYFTLIALVATLVASAQTIKVYEYDEHGKLNYTPSFISSDEVKVVFTDEILSGITDGHEWVDLGLPSGTLWATCNIGANSPEEYGDYFAWGETAPKEKYDGDTYKWINEGQWSSWQINKYTYADGEKKLGCWYNGDTFIGDGKLALDTEDDAATANWGSDWCMPTYDQLDELCNPEYITSEWTTTRNGINGRLITSLKNGNTIFLPAGGYRDFNTVPIAIAGRGCYWSSSLSSTYNSTRAGGLDLSSDYLSAVDYFSREGGRLVRPVRKK